MVKYVGLIVSEMYLTLFESELIILNPDVYEGSIEHQFIRADKQIDDVLVLVSFLNDGQRKLNSTMIGSTCSPRKIAIM